MWGAVDPALGVNANASRCGVSHDGSSRFDNPLIVSEASQDHILRTILVCTG